MTTGQGASRAVKGYMLNMEQMTLIGMRESKAVRRSVLAKLKVMHCPVIPQSLPEALRLAADLAEHNAKLKMSWLSLLQRLISLITTSMHPVHLASVRLANY